MMIALLTDEYPPARIPGGIGTYTHSLARLLSSNGHDVHVFCQNDGIPKAPNGEFVHEVTSFDLPARPLRYLYWRCVAPLWEPLQRRARWGLTVARHIIKTERALGSAFDVVEVPEAGGYAGFMRAGGVRSAILIRMHSGTAMLRRYSGRTPDRTTRLLSKLERWSLRSGDLVSAPSRAIIHETATELGIRRRTPCLLCPSPLPAQSMPPPSEWTRPNSKLILAVGRLCHLKGSDLVLRAITRLRRDFPDLRLVMAGRRAELGDALSHLFATAVRSGACAHTGELDSRGVMRLMSKAGIVVVASRFENLPYVVLEALQCGCLVVASDAGGIPEVLTHQHTGLLFKSGSVNDLVEKIRWALQHPDEARAIGRAGRTWISSKYSDEQVLNSVVGAYRLAHKLAKNGTQ